MNLLECDDVSHDETDAKLGPIGCSSGGWSVHSVWCRHLPLPGYGNRTGEMVDPHASTRNAEAYEITITILNK